MLALFSEGILFSARPTDRRHLETRSDNVLMGLLGEGEHKLMSFIRQQKVAKHYDPTTSHVVVGLDADLVMLALASHEPNFYILREKFYYLQPSGKMKAMFDKKKIAHEPFELVYIADLRYLLLKRIEPRGLPFRLDRERLIDDFIFLCFFVGNDFLPHAPSMSIYEGAIDELLKLYQVRCFS